MSFPFKRKSSKMWRSVTLALVCYLQYVVGWSQLCGNKTDLSCTTEIFGQNHSDQDCIMKVYPSNSDVCDKMKFGPLAPNTHIGGVTLKPYIMTMTHWDNVTPYLMNHTVLNITFSNIKWKTMKFRFHDKNRVTDRKNHCRDIMISNDVTIDDQSVFYYDCYWTSTDGKDGQRHMLDFEATTDDNTVNRGQYHFNIPSIEMLSPRTTEEEWKPFVYIEIFPSVMRLHIMPPPRQLTIKAFHIQVVTACASAKPCEVKSTTIYLRNKTDEVTYDYNFVGANGSFSFVVTPFHKKCDGSGDGCQRVESPTIVINSEPQTLNICIASITALIVASLFAYYIALRVIRRYLCNDDKYKKACTLEIDIPIPPKILVVYAPANRLHAECVSSFATYLRSEYGLDIMYDGDISATSHGDPYIWAEEAFRLATHIMYIVGPAEDINMYNNIYDKPIISAHKDIDTLLLSFVKASRASRSPKSIINVLFEHSDAVIPIETRNSPQFYLIKELYKLLAYISQNMLPKKHITRTEKGRCFLEDLNRAKKMLVHKADDVIVNCDKEKGFDKKILV